MPDSVIVTIRYGKKEQDFELPFRRPIGQWAGQLLSGLAVQAAGKEVLLYEGERLLAPEYTLEQYGIFDGAVLYLRLGV